MNIEINQLESFIFAENKDDFIKKLIPGTNQHYYFSLLRNLQNSEQALSNETKTGVENFKKINSKQSRAIELRYLLLKLEALKEEDEEERKKICWRLNELLYQCPYNYERPRIITASNLESQAEAVRSELNQSLLDPINFIENPHLENNIKELIGKGLIRVSPEKMKGASLESMEYFFDNAPLFAYEGIPDLLKKYYHIKRSKVSTFQLSEKVFKKITIGQLDELGKAIPDLNKNKYFVGELMKKKFKFDEAFSRTSETRKIESLKNHRERLLSIYDWSKALPHKFEGLCDRLLRDILQIGIEINFYDFDLFVEYLKDPKSLSSYANQKQLSKYKSKKREVEEENYWEEYKLALPKASFSCDKIVEQYLEYFFKTKKSIQPFDEFMDSEKLTKMYTTVRLHEGDEISNINEILDTRTLQEINNQKLINICKYNRTVFEQDEKVSIFVELKNVPSLLIKVFEINTENYYRKNMSEIDININLDGLIASEEQSFYFSDPPIRKVTQEFKFDNVSAKKCGVFIIDFLGNGISSRAIVRKGTLILLQRTSLAGNIFTLFNERLEACSDPNTRTGIYIDNTFHRANANGAVTIPFVANSRGFQNAIIIHGSFAKLTNISLNAENYKFACSYVYAKESFIMGNEAKIVIQPRLFVNGTPANMEIAKEQKITITSLTDNEVPSIIVLDRIKFDHREDILVSIPIPAKLKSIKIVVSGTITKLDGSKYDAHSEHSISVGDQEESSPNKFCIQVLRRNSKNEYLLYLLGKNGEPKQGIDIVLTFKHTQRKNIIVETLTTDPNGKISLGLLSGIKKLRSDVREKGDIKADSRSWTLEGASNVNYPSRIDLCENESLSLPFYYPLNKETLLFTSYNIIDGQETLLENLLQTLTIDNNFIKSNPLSEGTYRLVIQDTQNSIEIHVHKGQLSKKYNAILTSKDIIENPGGVNVLAIDKVEIGGDSDKNTISVTVVAEDHKLIRVHLFAYNFFPNSTKEALNTLKSNLPTNNTNVINKILSENTYSSNRKLGDEYCYVLDRKNQTRYVGNNLEKPNILLRRELVGDTNFDAEKINEGGLFDNNESMLKEKKRKCSVKKEKEKCEKRSRKVKAKKDRKFSSSDGESAGSGASNCVLESFTTTSLLNFLQKPSLVISNCKPNEKGIVELKDIELQGYTFLHVVCTDLKAVVDYGVSLNDSPLQKRDLLQKMSMEPKKYYSIFRDNACFKKGESFKIQDITSTTFQIIDNIPKLFEIQMELRACLGPDYENEKGYVLWEFLKTWESLSLEEKHKMFHQYTSHELHLFIYFKDRPYFDTYIQNHIKNKIEKGFIDFYLLSDKVKLKKYLFTPVHDDLNILEQILLVNFLVQEGEKKIAGEILNSIENRSKLMEKNYITLKRYFDTVLNSKKAGEVVERTKYSEMDDFEKQKCRRSLSNSECREEMICYKTCEMKACYDDDDYNDDNSCRAEEEENEEYLGDYYDGGDISQRKAFVDEFKNVETTKEYCERQYYKLDNSGYKNYVVASPFWVDLGNHILNTGSEANFLSANFFLCNKSHTEMIAVLSFLALPFDQAQHRAYTFEGKGKQIEGESNMIVFQKITRETKAAFRNEILISQRFLDPKDLYRFSQEDPNIKYEKEVEEFLVDRLYTCQVTVTNCSEMSQEFQLMVEVPEGSLPVNPPDYRKAHNVRIDPFTTKTFKNTFYFPSEGKFRIYPANVSIESVVVAVGKETEFSVVKNLKNKQLDTIDQVLEQGSKEDILEFLRTKNLFNSQIFNFSNIFYLLKEKEFYLKIVEILRLRRVYNFTVWSFSLYHGDIQSLKEFLMESNQISTLSGYMMNFQNDLVTLEKINILEYFPYVKSRVHSIQSAAASNILNVNLRNQYQLFLGYLCESSAPSGDDLLVFIYYLLLQDRLDEAIKIFQLITPESFQKNGVAQLQYDYFAAFLDFYIGYPNFKTARQICERYLDYPVIPWRNLFYEIANQLAEFDGEEFAEDPALKELEVDKAKNKNQKGMLMSETLSVDLQEKDLILNHHNVPKIEISYYKIDLEVFFSRNPFINQGGDEFSYVQANAQETIEIKEPSNPAKTNIKIPQPLENCNVFIQVAGSSTSASVTYFSTSLKVTLYENYGQIKVTDDKEKALSKVYVKAFAKEKNGTVRFYKDGYTDLRGRFDYGIQSASNIDNVEKFALFIMSDELGSIIKEAKAPSKLGRMEKTIELRSKAWEQKAEQKNQEAMASYLSSERKFKSKK